MNTNINTTTTVTVNDAHCDFCGAIVPEDTLTTVADGRRVCVDCMEDFVICDECGEYVHEGDICEVDGEYICIDCVDETDIVYCDHCEEYHRSDATQVYTCYGWEVWCDACVEEDAYRCEACGNYYDSDDIYWSERDDRYYCEDCFEEYGRGRLIGRYHEGNPNGLKFYGEIREWSYIKGRIGWELELFGNGERIAEEIYDAVGGFDFCHFEDDCTVDVEVVGQPMTLEYMYHEEDKFRAMFDAIDEAGGSAGNGAGLHVHVSRGAFGDTDEERADRISKCMMLFTGDAYERLTALAQRDASGDGSDWASATYGDRDAIKQRASQRGGMHGTAVNLEHRDTVEFRLGRSVDTYEEFIGWVEVIAYIVRKSATIPEATAFDFGTWFYDAPAHILTYMMGRGVAVPPPARPLTIADYERIIQSLLHRAQEAQHKRNTTLRALGLDDNELPRVPTQRELLAEVTAYHNAIMM